jgi:uncharacterized protein YqfA (UPF0365 family)
MPEIEKFNPQNNQVARGFSKIPARAHFHLERQKRRGMRIAPENVARARLREQRKMLAQAQRSPHAKAQALERRSIGKSNFFMRNGFDCDFCAKVQLPSKLATDETR